ncbi:SNF-related serine/threonine-protein kinase-like isoform X2 [Ptychodera flava]|uniref:SNF-related serine/threonine-protein kinase-like isoform X2 n=1 Tax=Ptychodera flava TaxID=63121 RepID=UPI00396AACEE
MSDLGRRSNYDGKIAGLYDLEETLGRGHFAIVKLARHVFTGEKVAVKVIDKTKLDEVSKAHLFQEVRCMKLVQHPHVVRLYEVIDTQTKLYLILELGDGGDMYDYIMKHEQGLDEDTSRTYFRQIIRAISYCHKLHVVHRDLKPENVVFFKQQKIVKLTDFGFSNKFLPGEKLETSCGSLAYSAPEILLGDSYDAPAVDIWSLGVLLYMLVTGCPPFNEANDSETLTMIMDCKYTLPEYLSENCKNLIQRMLIREPNRRANLEDIENDPWVKTGDIIPIENVPLIRREDISANDHEIVIDKMVKGNIANKEDILRSLKNDSYDHIAATYYLLAERRLRRHHMEKMSSQCSPLNVTNKTVLEPLALSPRASSANCVESPQEEFSLSTHHLVSPPVSQPISIPVPQTPPSSISSSQEDLCSSPLSGSPRRGLMSRDHLTIVPRHGRSVVKEGVSVLMEEEERRVKYNMMAIEEESEGNSSDGSSSGGEQSQYKLHLPVGVSRSLTSRKSQPLLQINEEEERESDDDMLLGSEALSKSTYSRHIASPEMMRQKFKQPKLKPKNPSRASNYSSSDASDDDTDNRRRCEHDIIRRKHRRGSKDGPPGGSHPGDSNNYSSNNHSGSRGGGGTSENKSTTNNTVNNTGSNNKEKKSNELRDSLKTSNLSVNSNCSNFSTSKYVIDPSNTTPSDSDDQSSENFQNRKISWSKKDFPDISESKMLILPKDEYCIDEKLNHDDAKSEKSKIGCTCMCGRLSKEINSNMKVSEESLKVEMRKTNLHSSQCSLHNGGQAPRVNQSNCCRLI